MPVSVADQNRRMTWQEMVDAYPDQWVVVKDAEMDGPDILSGILVTVKPDETLTDWRCRQRALVKRTDTHEGPASRCDCRIVRETEAQRAVVMAFNTLPTKREELIVAQERLQTGEIGRIDALLKTIDEQQDRLEERLEMLAAMVPEDEEPLNTTVVDELGTGNEVTREMSEADFLRTQIVELRRRKDKLYAERAEHANTEVQIRLLLELVDEMVKGTLPEWMRSDEEDRIVVEEDGYEVVL